jgi:putative endonuclease
MPYVYVLWSNRLQKRYVGSTGNIIARLKSHNQGSNKFIRCGVPWMLVHQEEFEANGEARKRENFLEERRR